VPDRGRLSAPCPSCFSPAEDPMPNAQEAGWASGLVCMALKILLPLEFNPWTTQPVASRYTDYANANAHY